MTPGGPVLERRHRQIGPPVLIEIANEHVRWHDVDREVPRPDARRRPHLEVEPIGLELEARSMSVAWRGAEERGG